MSAEVCDRGPSGRTLLPLADARARLLAAASPPARPAEEVALRAARGRTLAEPVRLDRPEPPVDRSAMDGFAVRSADGPAPRRLVGTAYAGTTGVPAIGPGEACAVMTGGTVADGADAVVPVEHTRIEDGVLHLDTAPEAGRHIRRAGEIGAAGTVVMPAGVVLGVPGLAAAASCGADPVRVHPRPRASVLSTGDEVVAWEETPEPHQVRDGNRLTAALQLASAGAEVLATRRVADDPARLEEAVEQALAAGELVVTIGGVSMGEKDHLPTVFERLGVERLFHGVAVQPGKPVWAGQRDGRWVIGLPGNPVSAWVIGELMVRPLVARLAGAAELPPLPLQACRAGGAARSRGRERYLPARVHLADDGVPVVTPQAGRGSGDWTVMAGADALLRLPPQTELAAGDAAHYLPLPPG